MTDDDTITGAIEIDTDFGTEVEADAGAEQIEERQADPEELVDDIIRIAADPRAARSRFNRYRRAKAAAVKREERAVEAEGRAAEREARAVEAEARAAEALSKLEAARAELIMLKDAREEQFAEREKRINELERQWAFCGEDDATARGFRRSEFSSLMKARAAYGLTTGIDDLAREMAQKFPPHTVRSSGVDAGFPAGTTLSRAVEAEAPPPTAVRVRPERQRRGAEM